LAEAEDCQEQPEQNDNQKKKWWQKEISPTISFIFLIIAILFVFIMGWLFIKEYLNVWSEISKNRKEISFPEFDLNFNKFEINK